MHNTTTINSEAVATLLKVNPTVKLQRFNFLNEQAVVALDWQGVDQEELLPQLKALQRLIRLTGSQKIAEALYHQGLHAAVQIASMPQHQFVKQYATVVGGTAQAKQVHQKALASKSQAVLTYTALAQQASPYYQAMRGSNLGDAPDSNYLPSYQKLFGNTDFCDCPACRSILSPAAYFVDLMRLQANYIETASNAHALQDRRPDLWKIELSCDHTNTEVPKLKLVNEVLLAKWDADANQDYSDPKVQEDTYQKLLDINYPFNLPFHLPLHQIRQYLAQYKTDLASLWEQLLVAPDETQQKAIALERLAISPEQWNLLSTSVTDGGTLCTYYGFTGANPEDTLKDVATFLAQTDLSHNQLNELLGGDLSEKDLRKDFFINVGDDEPIEVEDGTTLNNLTPQRLDHIHRFIRLAQVLGWSFTDLDWALRTIAKVVATEGGPARSAINDAALPYLAWMQSLQQTSKLSINQCCAWIGTLKDFGEKDGPTFFKQIFSNPNVPNPPEWHDEKGQYHLAWKVPTPSDRAASSSDTALEIPNALAAALQISQDDLLAMANQVLNAQNITDQKLPLSLQNLSILYRLSHLPALTGLSIAACFTALRLPWEAGEKDGAPCTWLQKLAGSSGSNAWAVLNKLSQLAQWLQKSGFTVYQLQFMLTGTSQDPTLQNHVLGTDAIQNFVTGFQSAIQGALLTEASFSAALGSLLSQSAYSPEVATKVYEKLQANAYVDTNGVLVQKPTQEQVKKLAQSVLFPYTPSSGDFTNPKLLESIVNLITDTLNQAHQLQQKTLMQRLASLYNVSPKLVPTLIAWGGLTLGELVVSNGAEPQDVTVTKEAAMTSAAAPLIQLLLLQQDQETESVAEASRVTQRLQLLQRYACLVTSLSLSAAEAQAVLKHPEWFGVDYSPAQAGEMIPQLTVGNVQALYQFKRLAQYLQDTQNHLLTYFQQAADAKAAADALACLAKMMQWDQDQLSDLVRLLCPNYGTVTGVALLATYFTTAQQLGIDTGSLWQLAQLAKANNYQPLQAMANTLWGGLQKNYKDHPDTLAGIQNKLEEQKRDALLGLVMHKLSMHTPRDLYAYLLIDVAVSAAVQTSCIKEAISAVQLYIYRCLNHLEQGVDVQEDLITWWSWMEHYRTWQANREVFLYPENYIQPELRKHKTPEFEQLEQVLHQADLTNISNVEAAFRSYTDGFAEVANLKIVGCASYSQGSMSRDNQSNKLCFIGRTGKQPYTYYYRTAVFTLSASDDSKDKYAPTEWNPWLKIDIHLNPTGQVSPVFAKGKWWIFWGEKQQSGAVVKADDQDSNSSPPDRKYSYSAMFSYTDFNGRWIAPQKVEAWNGLEAADLAKNLTRSFIDGWFILPESNLFSLEDDRLSDQLKKVIRYVGYNDPTLSQSSPETFDIGLPDGQSMEYTYYWPYGFRNMQDGNAEKIIQFTPPANGFSLSFWFSLNSYTDYDAPILLHQNPDKGFYIMQKDDAVNPYTLSTDNNPDSIDTTAFGPPLQLGNWYHLVVTVEKEGNTQAYCNGVLLTDVSNSYFSATEKIIMGYADTSKHTFQKGCMQQILQYDRVLSSEEVIQLYDCSTISSNFEPQVNNQEAFSGLSPDDTMPVINQPNWEIIQAKGIEALAIPYTETDKLQLDIYRLNTTAVHGLSAKLFLGGIDGLLTIKNQQAAELPFASLKPKIDYIPVQNWPSDTIDLSNEGGISLYYWELFFQVPFLIAHSLQTQQQFAQAKQWYEYIFNPTIEKKYWNLADQEDSNDKYWRFWGLRSQYNAILHQELGEAWAAEVQDDTGNTNQLYQYHNDPFDPHAIAALRPIAYQKAMVMHYIDNLLDWADSLYRQNTIETIEEATMLYVMAYDLLGQQPTSSAPCQLPDAMALDAILDKDGKDLSQLPELLIEIEQSQSNGTTVPATDTPHNYIPHDYFGLPESAQFMAYWDKVKQRLYNIRHSLTIDGTYDHLALFQPPIDPMQLVQAVASGEGVGAALNSGQVALPHYRFSVMVAKAQAVVQPVIQLGQALLGVLEKQDAEQLTLLYHTQQQNLLALTRTSKQDQLEAATQSVAALQASLQNAQDRLNHYTQLISKGLSSYEQTQQDLETSAVALQSDAQAIKGAAVAGYLLPTVFGLADGGFKPGHAIQQGANVLEGSAFALSMAGGLAATMAGYQRRQEDWQLQKMLAQDDIQQMQYQIAAAQYQEHVANQEITLLEKQITQAQAVVDFLKNKFTRQQLYQWMVGKLSTLYFQAYQLAYSMGLQAEQAWQLERGRQQTFVQPGHWEDLHHGLVAGEALQLDLQRMEKAYMDQDQRKLEIQKTISLKQLDEKALSNLQSTGRCTFDLTAKDFDQDYPGHYFRTIKTVSLSFPVLLGPYQDLHATLTQTSSKTLLKADKKGVNYLLNGGDQPDASVLRVDVRANQQVALSQGLNESGLFVLNFNDERYLPFEGTGAVSSWQLEMPQEDNSAINFKSLTDVIIHLQYTALSGGNDFKEAVRNLMKPQNGVGA